MTQEKPTDGGSPGQPTPLNADVMIDLETLGTVPGCVVLSIGAVLFDAQTGRLGPDFYRNIDRASALAIGLTVDEDTESWWREQSPEARARLEVNPQPILEVLADFTAWWSDVGGRRFWGHGAGFDEPILRAAFKAAGLPAPWSFSRSRDTRTIYDLANVAPNRDVGVHHDALVDARNQAVAVCDAFRKLGLTAPGFSESGAEIGIPPFGRAAPVEEPAAHRPGLTIEFPYAIGSKVLERERQLRIAAGAFVGAFVGATALYLIFWLLPPAVGAVAIVAGWLPWGAVVGALIMARRS